MYCAPISNQKNNNNKYYQTYLSFSIQTKNQNKKKSKINHRHQLQTLISHAVYPNTFEFVPIITICSLPYNFPVIFICLLFICINPTDSYFTNHLIQTKTKLIRCVGLFICNILFVPFFFHNFFCFLFRIICFLEHFNLWWYF